MILDKYFERIAVISLDKHGARRKRCLEGLSRGYSQSAAIHTAVVCAQSQVPKIWIAGAPAYGCYQSHLQVIESALKDGVKTLLVVEDDAIFQNDGGRLAEEFMEALPRDWEQVYLGGQHRWAPEQGQHPAIYHAKSVHRTHCYGLSRRGMRRVRQWLLDWGRYVAETRVAGKKFGGHIDHWLECGHRSGAWRVYAPTFWLCGQGDSESGILNKKLRRMFFHYKRGMEADKLPIVLYDDESFEGSSYVVTKKRYWDSVKDPAGARQSLRTFANQCLQEQALPGCPERLQRFLPSRRRLISLEEAEAECEWAVTKPFAHPWINPHLYGNGNLERKTVQLAEKRVQLRHKRLFESSEKVATREPQQGEDCPFFIFATPRSRSTLLMRMLDKSSGVRCGGEMKNLLWDLKKIHGRRSEHFGRTPESFRPLSELEAEKSFPSHLCHSSAEGWDSGIINLLKRWNGAWGERFWGMKDVHVGKRGLECAFPLWTWLLETMPTAKLIFLTRDFSETLASMASLESFFIPSYGSCSADLEKRLMRQREAFQAFGDFYQDSCIRLDSEDVLDYELLSAKLGGIPLSREAHHEALSLKLRGFDKALK